MSAELDKSAINADFQRRYDEGMAAGKHGHYETMFTAMHQAYAAALRPENEHGFVEIDRLPVRAFGR